MTLRVVPSPLYVAARLDPYIIILLHGVLHAIIAPRLSLHLEQYPAISSITIHSLPLIATKDFAIPSAAPPSTNPYCVAPASSKAVPSMQSVGVSFDTPGGNNTPPPLNKHQAPLAVTGHNNDDHFISAITAAANSIASPLAIRSSTAVYSNHNSSGINITNGDAFLLRNDTAKTSMDG